MKLRNKKTGKTVYIEISIPVIDDNGEVVGGYLIDNLAELNAKFEDYTPSEPLIKDEKVRKVVREWAECCCAKVVNHCICDDCSCFMFTDEKGNDCSLDFPYRADNLESNADYTIAELCGEEEE